MLQNDTLEGPNGSCSKLAQIMSKRLIFYPTLTQMAQKCYQRLQTLPSNGFKSRKYIRLQPDLCAHNHDSPDGGLPLSLYIYIYRYIYQDVRTKHLSQLRLADIKIDFDQYQP